MSGEPKTLTQIAADNRVEAIRIALAGTSELATAVRLEDGRWHAVNLSDGNAWDNHTLEELEQLAIAELSTPLVARDEAAELRAAIREFFKAEAAVAALYHPNGIYHDFHEAADIANTARENLRRLAGGEGEK